MSLAVSTDPASGNVGIGQSNYPILSERLRQDPKSDPR